jgi:membrane associated rhomboid family serine protease
VFLPIRDDAPRPRIPFVTLGLLFVNMAIYLAHLFLSTAQQDALLYAGGAVPFEISRMTDVIDGGLHPRALVPPPLTLITSLFLHGSPAHIAGNLWFLWFFGDSVEASMGPVRFLAFYLVAGLTAAIAQVAMTPDSMIPIVGASGAIAGVLGAYMALYPRARIEIVLFLLFVIEIVVVPAYFVLGVWLAWQLVLVGDGSIAVWAHVGGFLAGAAVCRLFARRARRVAPVRIEPQPWIRAAESSSLPL